MSPTVTAVVAVARCQHDRAAFGIRFEQTNPSQWQGDWAFALEAATAQRERFDRTKVEGEIGFAPTYPGCPHCASLSVFICGCGKLTCWSGQTNQVVCAWCGQAGEVGGIARSLEVDQDS